MKRTTFLVGAAMLALTVLLSTSWVGFTAPAGPQQDSGTFEVSTWISDTDREDAQPIRRFDPGTPQAWVIVDANLRPGDPTQYYLRVKDASGNTVFQSGILDLSTQARQTLPVTGKDFFQTYVTLAQTQKGDLIDGAIDVLEEEEAKEPCAQDPSQRTQPARVADQVGQVLRAQRAVDSILRQLLGFSSLESVARVDLTDARTELETVSTRGSDAIDKLEIPDDAPRCPNIEAPDWEPDWDAVRADLEAMQTAGTAAVSKIDSALETVDLEADRSFPTTAVEGQCSQNTVQLRSAIGDSIVDDFWWTVAMAGPPARLRNPEEPDIPTDPSEPGNLKAEVNRIYATTVSVAGANHTTEIAALVLDAKCVPVEGATVNFSLGEDDVELAVLSASQATSDANGVASVNLQATDQTGDGNVTVNGRVDSAEASASVHVIGPPAQVSVQVGSSVRIAKYGVGDVVQVSAQVLDANRNPVADGTEVTFRIVPEDHTFSDSTVQTVNGQASTPLTFGESRGFYQIFAEADNATDSQVIEVVGPPAKIAVTVEPATLWVRQGQLNADLIVKVSDDRGRPAPDSTMVEFEFVNPDDAHWVSLQRSSVALNNGTATTTLVASSTGPGGEPVTYRGIRIHATATYRVGTDIKAQVSGDVYVHLGRALYLPLLGRNIEGQ